MEPKDILLFTESGAGKGRDSNDSNNKKREAILKILSTSAIQEFLSCPIYGVAWQTLQTKWHTALTELAKRCHITDYSSYTVKNKGGRKFNWDIDVTYADHTTVKVEFKFGGTSVDSIPEFFNPAADKPFHPELYASFFYDTYLDQVMAIYGLVEKPTKDLYLKQIHKNTSSSAFFKALRAAEDAEVEVGRPKYKAKTALAHKSIQEYLAKYKDSTNLQEITSEFTRSQAGKHFLIYSNGEFHHDRIEDDELIATSVIGVEGDYLIIQSKKPTTTHRMLLRWKNHQCVLFPAWQISMVRRG